MSDRRSARHRAPQRPLTPLDSLTDTLGGQLTAVGEQLGTYGRSGAVLAVSTGLVATMGLPAGAVTKTAPENGAAFARSSVASAAAVTLPASVLDGAAVSAPAGATVTFERKAITVTATVKPKRKPRVAERAARSSERSRPQRANDVTDSSKDGNGKDDNGSDAPRNVKGGSVVSIARQLLGIPYVYGGTTTRGFDCSGFTRYVFAKAGVSLPRTSGQQYAASRRISRSEARAGDLVFIFSGGRVTHVGIFVGGNRMIDSPRPGKSTQEREIWSSNIAFGRV